MYIINCNNKIKVCFRNQWKMNPPPQSMTNPWRLLPHTRVARKATSSLIKVDQLTSNHMHFQFKSLLFLNFTHFIPLFENATDYFPSKITPKFSSSSYHCKNLSQMFVESSSAAASSVDTNNNIKGVATHGGRYVQYNVHGTLFEVSRKYVPPIRPVGRGAFGIVW